MLSNPLTNKIIINQKRWVCYASTKILPEVKQISSVFSCTHYTQYSLQSFILKWLISFEWRSVLLTGRRHVDRRFIK